MSDFILKWVRLGPKWNKSGTFSEQISIHFGSVILYFFYNPKSSSSLGITVSYKGSNSTQNSAKYEMTWKKLAGCFNYVNTYIS